MKHLKEIEPIILSGSWSRSSHPDQIIKIFQFTDFIIFHRTDGVIGYTLLTGTITRGDQLEIIWPEIITSDMIEQGAVHKTTIIVKNDSHIEVVADRVLIAHKHTVHKAGKGKWKRRD